MKPLCGLIQRLYTVMTGIFKDVEDTVATEDCIVYSSSYLCMHQAICDQTGKYSNSKIKLHFLSFICCSFRENQKAMNIYINGCFKNILENTVCAKSFESTIDAPYFLLFAAIFHVQHL